MNTKRRKNENLTLRKINSFIACFLYYIDGECSSLGHSLHKVAYTAITNLVVAVFVFLTFITQFFKQNRTSNFDFFDDAVFLF